MQKVRVYGVAGVAVVAACVLIAAMGATWVVRRPVPAAHGTVHVSGLAQQVVVHRDNYGIPTITGAESADVFRVQGYVHASERMFQMSVARRRANGTMAALVGPVPEAIASDRLARTLGFAAVANAERAALDPGTKEALQAYSDGVNDYLQSHSLGEADVQYSILGTVVDLEAESAWQPTDSLAILKAAAWDNAANVDAELGRAAAFDAVENLAAVAQVYPPYPADRHAPVVVRADAGAGSAGDAEGTEGSDKADAGSFGRGSGQDWSSDAGDASPAGEESQNEALARAAADQELVEVLSAPGVSAALQRAQDTLAAVGPLWPGGGAATTWAISGNETASGAPLLVADTPGPAAIPGPWLQNALHCEEVTEKCAYRVTGVSMPGVPGVYFGRNQQVAWTVSASGADTVDVFLERIKGRQYQRGDEWHDLVVHPEDIPVTGGDQVVATVAATERGVVLEDLNEVDEVAGARAPGPLDADSSVVTATIAWTGRETSRSMDALLALNRAGSWEEFVAAAQLFGADAPALTYADSTRHIAFQVAGAIPVRGVGEQPAVRSGAWPRPGWEAEWDWSGIQPFAALPGVVDPAGEVIVAAGQLPDAASRPIGVDFAYGHRAHRVSELLAQQKAAGGKYTGVGMQAIQLDVVDQYAPLVVPQLISAPLSDDAVIPVDEQEFTAEAVRVLKEWADDGYRMDAGEPGAAFYAAVYSNLLRLTFADEVGEVAVRGDGSRWAEALTGLMAQPAATWWDDTGTATVVEQRDQILATALYQARLELTADIGKNPDRWQWGNLHETTLRNTPLGGATAQWWMQKLLNVKDVPSPGGLGTINQLGWDAGATRDYAVTELPTVRMITDLAPAGQSYWVTSTGVSGHRGSGHYRDQFDLWCDGEYVAWSGPEAAPSGADTLVFASSDPGGDERG